MPRKVIKIGITVFLCAIVYVHYFLYWDIGTSCYVTIKPSLLEWSNLNMKRAIGLLKRVSPEDYRDLCAVVDTVDPNYSCGGMGGGCAWSTRPHTIDVSTAKDDLAWTAAIMVHEVCHLKQFASARAIDENECYREDDRVIKKILVIPE